MSAVESLAVTRAVELVQAGASITAAAKQAGVAIQSVRRALRRRGVPGRTHPTGEAHHAFIDGRTAARRAAAAQRAAVDHRAATPCATE